MIVWINGAFGAGKTTLCERLAVLLPGSMVVDPEVLGTGLRWLVPESSTGDFQDLPIWRSLTLHTLREVRRLYRRPVLVPMTMVNPGYLEEIHGGLAAAGEELVHVFLDVAEPTLRSRIEADALDGADSPSDAQRRWRLTHLDRCLAARDLMPAGTRFLDSGSTDPDVLARQVIAWVGDAVSVSHTA